MSFDEIKSLLDGKERKRRERWEMLRTEAFYSVAAMTDKVKKPSDLFKLPWEITPKKVSNLNHKKANKIANKIAGCLGRNQ